MSQIVFVTGSRSEYSLMRRLLLDLQGENKITVIATGMHLSPKFGKTISEIEQDGFEIKKVDSLLDTDTLGGMIKSLSISLHGIASAIEELSPDLILIEGDRGEALAGALAGAYLNIPVCHHGGGDSSGSVDNKLRSATSMLSDYHLVGNLDSYNNLLNMGIPKNRIFIVGEPGIDDIVSGAFEPLDAICSKYNLDPKQPSILLVFHPNTEEYDDIDRQITELTMAIESLNFRTIAVYSNADAGGQLINQRITEVSELLPCISTYPNLSRRDFLGLMNACSVMVGNSSAGIVELPSFKKPFVCVGTRQKGRLKAKNVLEVEARKSDIIDAIQTSIHDEDFKRELQRLENPYGDGRCSLRVCRIIQMILEKPNDRDK